MKKQSIVKKILMLIFALVLVSTSFVSLTVSKYVTEQNAPFQGDEHLDYTVNTVFVVKNQEELFAAINQGYTYVQLDQNIENPLIVTQKAETLNADLILDLNGIEIQRNGYEPILNIKPGVRLTVVDTSNEQTGGLYNPVGSVFNITGGTLTVVTGTFESGPRYSEYYSYNTEVLNGNNKLTNRTIVEDKEEEVIIQRKISEGNGESVFGPAETIKAPIIKSYPEKIGGIEYNHGNLYFDKQVTKGNLTIKPDTYCYYRTSEDKAAEVNNEAAADWYYSYFVDANNGFKYVGPTADESVYVKVTIYGYEKTIKQASEIQEKRDYYAAIQMQSGTLDVQNGGFFSYFGVDRTACVNSQGGSISIKKGKFSSRIPNATSTTQNSVNEKEVDELAFDAGYFNTYRWTDDDVNAEFRGNLARQGESYCILNGGDATVTIGTGELYSSNNGIISMHGGELSILGGNFNKRVTNGRVTTVNSEMSAIYMEQGSLTLKDASCNVLREDGNAAVDLHAIYMQAGVFDSINTTYLMNGAYSTGIKMLNGKLNVSNGDCSIVGAHSYGIHSSIASNTDFVVTNSSFDIQGANSTGIYSANGRVNISADTARSISVSGENGKGIHVLDKGSVISSNYSYNLSGNGSIGILADNSATGINVSDGSMSISGANSYGIKSSITGTDNFTVTDVPINMHGGGINQTGIYSAYGKVTVNANTPSAIETSGENGIGIYVLNGGSVDSKNYSYYLTGKGSIGILASSNATGIDVSNGEISISGAETFGIKSSITGTDNFTVKDVSIAMTGGGAEQTGIFSENGRVSVSTSSSKTISTSGNNGKGIHVLNDGSVYSENYNYNLNGASSIGIYAEVDATGIDVINGSMTVQGNNTFGIRSYINDGGSGDKFNVTDMSITMTNGTYQTGIFSENGKVNVIANSSKAISIEGNQGKGIHVSTGGSVYSEKYSYTLTGTNSHGIYSTAGTVDLLDGNITLDSNVSCYGIYAFSTGNIGVNVNGTTIDVGYAKNTNNKNNGTYRASVGVFLASNSNSNKIILTNTNIRCYEVGVLIDGGSLEVKSTTTATNEITTRKASSIVVKGGSIEFDENCNYNITSYTTRSNQTTNAFNITLPTINLNTNANYDNFDGVYVSGGDFTSNGNVNITHTGLRNDISKWTYYDDIVIKSFAVRVLDGEVELSKASITNSVGGGVMCDGGDVTLGTADSQKEDITIQTTGKSMDESWGKVVANAGGEWTVHKTSTGGHAVEIKGGNLTAYHGLYKAAYGDGIKLFAGKYTKTDENNGKERTTVNIHNGEYIGNMEGEGTHQVSGPAACYGVKVFGSAVINIMDGKFDGRGGGACVSGVTDYLGGTKLDYSAEYPANVYIYKGEFGSAKATDGFMIYEYANIIFGAAGANYFKANDTIEYRKNAIIIHSEYAPFSVNWITYNNSPAPKSAYSAVYYGTYTGNYHGWNKGGNASAVQIYNQGLGYTVRTGNTYAEAVNVHNNRTVYYYPQT